ncbi:DUF554 family protein, partial [Salmonella enterica subsp. enterica serovar Kentucky]|nr:DUF554 family protein [Salmonella enterica subsp. enterica serovar Kentucky]
MAAGACTSSSCQRRIGIIFACSLGIAVSAICAPMLIIQLTLAACATLILPLTTPAMMG